MRPNGSVESRIDALLRAAGMKKIRGRKHIIWKHPDGRSFTTSASPSDQNAQRQILRSLEKFLHLRPSAEKAAHS